MTENDLDTLDELLKKMRGEFKEELRARVKSLPIDRFAVLIAWVMARHGWGDSTELNLKHLVAKGEVVKGVLGQVYVEAWRADRPLGLEDAKAFVKKMRRRNLSLGYLISPAEMSAEAKSFLFRNHLDPHNLFGMLGFAEAGVRLAMRVNVYRVDDKLFDFLEEGPWKEAKRIFDGRSLSSSIASHTGPERK
jgi:hypothetical protein